MRNVRPGRSISVGARAMNPAPALSPRPPGDQQITTADKRFPVRKSVTDRCVVTYCSPTLPNPRTADADTNHPGGVKPETSRPNRASTSRPR